MQDRERLMEGIVLIVKSCELMTRRLKLNNSHCTNDCHRVDLAKKHDVRYSHRNSWNEGYKRCRNCEVYIRDGSNKCFCCNRRLAIRPRNAKYKKILQEKQGVKRY